jgi:energy-coupling factor transport system substrate-specific component
MNESKKLKGKDLVNIGIFAAIYFVIMFAVACLGFIPIFMPLLYVLVPLIGGIAYMLFMTKVKTFGMITIFSTICGILGKAMLKKHFAKAGIV